MPRHDKKAYTTLTARMPQDLVDQVQQYAQQHRCTVAELLRDGLVMRLESGAVPGRSTPQRPAPDAEVRPEVLHEVLHALEPRIQAWIQAAVQQTATEVRHGQPAEPQGHTEVIPHEQTAVVPLVPTIPHPPPSGQTKGRPDKASPAQPTGKGHTKGRPRRAMPVSSASEVIHGQTSTPAESPPSTGGLTEVRPQEVSTHGGLTEVIPLAVPADPPTGGGQTSGRPPPEAQAPPSYNPTKFTLGKLCRAGHAYGSTGQTLRRIANHNCVACNEEQQRAHRARQKAAQEG